MNYFDVKNYVSVSFIKLINELYFGGTVCPKNERALKIGTYTDMVLTQKLEKSYIPDDIRNEVEMCVDLYETKREFHMPKGCKFQHEFYGNRHNTLVKGKADVMYKNIIEDIKTTSTDVSQKNVKDTIKFFDYDMQAAAYIEMFRAEYFVFTFLCYKNEQCVQHIVKKGDDIFEIGMLKWLSGLERAKFLGYGIA